ncbi:MAG: hypothetical protein IKD85_06275, partial [Firmicutes bacterium]|nr:hypothetical protein [Bacillota bacterium]
EYVKNCIRRDFPEDVAEILTMLVEEKVEKLSAEAAPEHQGDQNEQAVDVMISFIALMQAYNQILHDEDTVAEYCRAIADAAPEEIMNAPASE